MKQWTCDRCSWRGQSEDHVEVLFHQCKREPGPKRVVPMPSINDTLGDLFGWIEDNE